MEEKRRSRRIDYLGTGWLQFRDMVYFCRLKNISLHGAMVGLRDAPGALVQAGERCRLRLYQDMEGQQYREFAARVVRYESDVAGIEFTETEGASREVLEGIIRKEQRLSEGARNIISLVREVAGRRGIELTELHFDRGELIPEREIHTLRFSAGRQRSNVHLHRADIEGCATMDDNAPAGREIRRAMERLQG